MNDPTQHEFDDELLSAYLDDELTPDERALVEARLESDPVARQTLEHLRSVSQSVHDLPTTSPGRNLHNAILHRIETAKLTSPSRGVHPPGPTSSANDTARPASASDSNNMLTPLPTVTIGRTTRGWVWACAAVAAALLIMFLQPSDEENAGLPNVAENSEPRSGGSVDKRIPELQLDDGRREARDFARQELPEMKPAPTSAATPAAPAASVSGELSEAVTAPTASPPSALADNQPAATSRHLDALRAGGQEMATAAQPVPFAGAEPLGVASQPAAAGQSGAADQPAAPPIVVHVMANRYAIENNKFEDLLLSNGVVLEPAAPADETKEIPPDGDATSKRLARSERLSSTAPADAAAEPADKLEAGTEAVLVDAPAKMLVSCMNALNIDAENYPGIAVLGDKPISSSESSGVAIDSTREKETGADLSKFSRGIVPPADAKLPADVYHFYGVPQASQLSRREVADANVGGGFGGGKIESNITSGSASADRGRARRIDPHAVSRAPMANRSLNFNLDTSSPTASDGGAKSLGPRFTANGDDRLQVLFIIHPTDAAATATTPAPTLKAKLPAQQPSP